MNSSINIKSLKDSLSKEGILNERISSSFNLSKNIEECENQTKSYLRIKKFLVECKSLNKYAKTNIDFDWCLKNIDKVTDSELQKIKNLISRTRIVYKVTKKNKDIIQLINLAKKLGIEVSDMGNPDYLSRVNVRKLRAEIDQILQPFDERKVKYIKRLGRRDVPSQIIQSIINSKTKAEFDNIINDLPPALLINAGLLKLKSKGIYLTKKSINAISTPMRD